MMNRNYKRFWIIYILCVFFVGNTFAQEESEANKYAPKGFDFFFDAGMYKGHKFNANYYSGDPYKDSDVLNRRTGDPDINFIFRYDIRQKEIINLIKENNKGIIANEFDDIQYIGLSDMKYGFAFYFEVGLRYRFNESFMLSLLFGQARLTANGNASFGFKGTGVNLDQGIVYLQYPLMGKERRNFFQVQMTYLFHTTIPYIFPFFDLGVHLNSVKVVSSELIIHDRHFDMINRYGEGYNYDPEISYPEINPHIGGVGYGFMAGFGIRIAFNEWAALEPVVQVSADKLNLSSYGKIRPNFNFMVRLVVGDRLFAKKG